MDHSPVDDLGIRIKYGGKLECFMATDGELAIIQNEIESLLEQKSVVAPKYVDIELEKYRVDKKMQLLKDLFSEGKLTFEQLEKLLR